MLVKRLCFFICSFGFAGVGGHICIFLFWEDFVWNLVIYPISYVHKHLVSRSDEVTINLIELNSQYTNNPAQYLQLVLRPGVLDSLLTHNTVLPHPQAWQHPP